MAGVKGTRAPKPRGRPAKPEGRTKGRLVVVCNDAYEAWWQGVALHLRTDKSGAVDRIAAEWAKANGYEAPPPRV